MFYIDLPLEIGILKMLDDLSIVEVIEKIKLSGLPFNSRQLIYSRLINEEWMFDFHELNEYVGIDDAFDSVYGNFKQNPYDDESYIGC